MGQDWGGRRPLNPPDAPKVTKQDVETAAKEAGLQVFRGGFFHDKTTYQSDRATWWVLADNGQWYTLGDTNYIALTSIQEIVNGEWNEISRS